MRTFMTSEATISDWENYELTDYTDHSLLKDITEGLKHISYKSREKRRQGELLDELVQEHIESESKSTPIIIKSILDNLSKRS